MATAFVGLVLIIFIGNTIITKSRTQWWRDPSSLFRTESEPETASAPEVAPRRHAVAPQHQVVPRREAVAEPVARGGRHSMRAEVAVPIEHAETEFIPRFVDDRSPSERYLAR